MSCMQEGLFVAGIWRFGDLYLQLRDSEFLARRRDACRKKMEQEPSS